MGTCSESMQQRKSRQLRCGSPHRGFLCHKRSTCRKDGSDLPDPGQLCFFFSPSLLMQSPIFFSIFCSYPIADSLYPAADIAIFVDVQGDSHSGSWNISRIPTGRLPRQQAGKPAAQTSIASQEV